MDKKYFYLFNQLTDTIQKLESLTAELKIAQAEAEELFLEETEKFSHPAVKK